MISAIKDTSPSTFNISPHVSTLNPRGVSSTLNYHPQNLDDSLGRREQSAGLKILGSRVYFESRVEGAGQTSARTDRRRPVLTRFQGAGRVLFCELIPRTM